MVQFVASKNTEKQIPINNETHNIVCFQADELAEFHANTHIPLVVGIQNRYELFGELLYKVKRTFDPIISYRYELLTKFLN